MELYITLNGTLIPWKPQKVKLSKPYYLSIVSILEDEIESGSLPKNAKLPPQKQLADFFCVNLSTITRAFRICESKELIYAITGSGTFVRDSNSPKCIRTVK